MDKEGFKIIFLYEGGDKSVLSCDGLSRDQVYKIGEDIANCQNERILIDINTVDIIVLNTSKLIAFYATPLSESDGLEDSKSTFKFNKRK